MTTTSQSLPLEPNSLYIATHLLHDWYNGPNAFYKDAWHWSFFITDASGRAFQHHWSRVNNGAGECYQQRHIQTVTTTTANSVYVCFLKVNGWYNLADAFIPALLNSIYQHLAGVISPGELRRRTPPISCRTWIIDALHLFNLHGWMFRPDITNFLSTVESIVKDRSQQATERYFSVVSSRNHPNQFQATIETI